MIMTEKIGAIGLEEVDLDVENLLERMEKFYETGITRNLDFRKMMLSKLKTVIQENEGRVMEALYKDLGKSKEESYTTEIGIIYENISYFIKNLDRFSRKKKVRRHKTNMFSTGEIYREPYGKVLVISSFNYPFQLTMEPLIGAMAAGNTVTLKPSDQASFTERIIGKIIKEAFQPNYVNVVYGGKEAVDQLTSAHFDYIFFTGSPRTGKDVMRNASNNLVPVTLELGGKSPAIVGKRANIKNAARKIAYGKFLNAGQTCIAPDYVVVHEDVKDQFILELENSLKRFYGSNPKTSKDYSRIINERAFLRLRDMLGKDKDKIIYGGGTDLLDCYIEPTLLYSNDFELHTMNEEIFGPILPIISYNDINQVIGQIKTMGKPLALYIFTEDKKVQEGILKRLSFGGGAVNDTLFHITSPYMPFGGVGGAGMGRYHGKYSMLTFTHEKAILKSSSFLNMKFQEPPMNKFKFELIKNVMK